MTDSQQQQFCLRWNNFQANITSQFEALRDDEDFVDVTFACDGRRLQAHKVVLSACSPYFKELFKTNPCKHPIIFMRDVEFEHLQSLLEFMYAGEVNISQAELPTFLRTAESLQIRGLTDSQNNQHNTEKHSKTNNVHTSNGRGLISPSFDDERSKTPPPATSPPPLKRLCKRSDSPINSSPVPAAPPVAPTGTTRNRPLTIEPQVQLDCYKDLDIVEPKVELPEYGSDEECSPKQEVNALPGGFLSLDGGMEVLPSYPPTYAGSGMEGGLPGPSHGSTTELNQEQQADLRKLHSLDPRPCPVCNRMYSNLSNLRQHMRLIHNPQSVTCPLCNKPFKTKLYLKRHLVSFHELSVADRQRQGEIYQQHQVKVQIQAQGQGQQHRQGSPVGVVGLSNASSSSSSSTSNAAQPTTMMTGTTTTTAVSAAAAAAAAAASVVVGQSTNGGSTTIASAIGTTTSSTTTSTTVCLGGVVGGGGGGVGGGGGSGGSGGGCGGGVAGVGSAVGHQNAHSLLSQHHQRDGDTSIASKVHLQNSSVAPPPPPRLPPDHGETVALLVDSSNDSGKMRAYQSQLVDVDPANYGGIDVDQLSNDTKSFGVGGMLQYNATYH